MSAHDIIMGAAGNSSGPWEQIGSKTFRYNVPIKALRDIPSQFANLIPEGSASGQHFLHYLLQTASGDLPVAVAIRRDGSFLTQSCFSMYENSYALNVSSYTNIFDGGATNFNDDHDTLWMDSNGNGVLAFNQQNILNTGNWYRSFNATTISSSNLPITDPSITQYNPSPFIPLNQPGTSFVTTGSTFIAFPATGSGLWIKLADGSAAAAKVNNFSQITLNNFVHATPNNTIVTMSDGVNSFWVYPRGESVKYYYEIDLTNGTIYHSAQYAFSITSGSTTPVKGFGNDTEEDAIGCQLFAVDCAATFAAGRNFYYGRDLNWVIPSSLNASGNLSLDIARTANVSTNVQHGYDVFGSIGPDNYVWFADWGHDNGGLFDYGDDQALGAVKTNIKKLTTSVII